MFSHMDFWTGYALNVVYLMYKLSSFGGDSDDMKPPGRKLTIETGPCRNTPSENLVNLSSVTFTLSWISHALFIHAHMYI